MTYLDFPKMLSNFWKRPINVYVDGERPSGGGRRSGEHRQGNCQPDPCVDTLEGG